MTHPTVPDGAGHVLGADDQFHIEDEPIVLSGYAFESWIAFGFFWLLALNIFYQFFTRYEIGRASCRERVLASV